MSLRSLRVIWWSIECVKADWQGWIPETGVHFCPGHGIPISPIPSWVGAAQWWPNWWRTEWRRCRRSQASIPKDWPPWPGSGTPAADHGSVSRKSDLGSTEHQSTPPAPRSHVKSDAAVHICNSSSYMAVRKQEIKWASEDKQDFPLRRTVLLTSPCSTLKVSSTQDRACMWLSCPSHQCACLHRFPAYPQHWQNDCCVESQFRVQDHEDG